MVRYFVKNDKIHTIPPATKCKAKYTSEVVEFNFLNPKFQKCKYCFGE